MIDKIIILRSVFVNLVIGLVAIVLRWYVDEWIQSKIEKCNGRHKSEGIKEKKSEEKVELF